MKYIAASDASKNPIWLHQLLIQIDSFSKHGLVIEIFYASPSNGYRLCYLEQTLINIKPRNKLSSTLLTYLLLCSITSLFTYVYLPSYHLPSRKVLQ